MEGYITLLGGLGIDSLLKAAVILLPACLAPAMFLAQGPIWSSESGPLTKIRSCHCSDGPTTGNPQGAVFR